MVWTADIEPVLGTELLTDRSFELGLAEVPGNWERSPRADRERVVDARDGKWIQDAEFTRAPGFAEGRFGQRFTLVSGTEGYPHLISFWVRCTIAAGATDPDDYGLDLVQYRLGLFPSRSPLFMGTVGDNEQIGEIRLDYLTLTNGADTKEDSLGNPTRLVPTPPWKRCSFFVVPARTDVLIWGLGDYVGPPSAPNPKWATMLEFDSFSMKQLFWDGLDDPSSPYTPD
jgi:hypothetical protein